SGGQDREEGQNRPGAPGWLRRFAATLRLADSPALRREAAQPTPDIPHQKDTRQPDKFKPGLDPRAEWRIAFTHRPIALEGGGFPGRLPWPFCSTDGWRPQPGVDYETSYGVTGGARGR